MKARRTRWARQYRAAQESLVHYAAPGLLDDRPAPPGIRLATRRQGVGVDPRERARVEFEQLFNRRGHGAQRALRPVGGAENAEDEAAPCQ